MSNLIKNKNGVYVLPGIVSIFLPGVGQLIKGHVRKGVAFIGVAIVFWILRWLLSWVPLVGWAIGALGFIALVINIIDAFMSKKDIKDFNQFSK